MHQATDLVRKLDRDQLHLPTLPLAVSVTLAAFVSLATLVVMAAIAGWEPVVDQLKPNLSFWFAVAFVAESISFAAYVLAYRGIAHIEGGPQLSLRQATQLVAVGFGAFLAKGGAALDSKVLTSSDSAHEHEEGEIRVLALDALEHAPLAPAACVAAMTLLVQGKRKHRLTSRFPGRHSSRWARCSPSSTFVTGTASGTVLAGAASSATFSKGSGSSSASSHSGGSTGSRSSAPASTGSATSPASGPH